MMNNDEKQKYFESVIDPANKAYLSSFNISKSDMEDFRNESMISFIESDSKYDTEINESLESYDYYVMTAQRWCCQRFIKKIFDERKNKFKLIQEYPRYAEDVQRRNEYIHEGDVDREKIRKIIKKVMSTNGSKFKERNNDIFFKYFYLNQPLRNIAKEKGITFQRINQIVNEILKKMKFYVNQNGIKFEDFLQR